MKENRIDVKSYSTLYLGGKINNLFGQLIAPLISDSIGKRENIIIHQEITFDYSNIIKNLLYCGYTIECFLINENTDISKVNLQTALTSCSHPVALLYRYDWYDISNLSICKPTLNALYAELFSYIISLQYSSDEKLAIFLGSFSELGFFSDILEFIYYIHSFDTVRLYLHIQRLNELKYIYPQIWKKILSEFQHKIFLGTDRITDIDFISKSLELSSSLVKKPK